MRPGPITQPSSGNRLAHNELCQNKKSDYSVGPRKSLAGKDGTTVYDDQGVTSPRALDSVEIEPGESPQPGFSSLDRASRKGPDSGVVPDRRPITPRDGPTDFLVAVASAVFVSARRVTPRGRPEGRGVKETLPDFGTIAR